MLRVHFVGGTYLNLNKGDLGLDYLSSRVQSCKWDGLVIVDHSPDGAAQRVINANNITYIEEVPDNE